MSKADGLSRRLDWQERVEKDNEDQTLIKPEQTRKAEALVKEEDLRKRIQKVQEGDERVVKAVEKFKRARMKSLKNEKWKIEDRVVMKKGQIYILEEELREEVIQLYHDTPVEGHRGRQKTMELITRNY